MPIIFFHLICYRSILFIDLLSIYCCNIWILWKTKCLLLYLCWVYYFYYCLSCSSSYNNTYFISILNIHLLWSKNSILLCSWISVNNVTNSWTFHIPFILFYNPYSPNSLYLSYTLSLVLFISLPINFHLRPYLFTSVSNCYSSYFAQAPWWFIALNWRKTYL